MVAHKLIAVEYLANVTRRILVQFLIVSEYDDGHINGAEDRQLMSLLEQTTFTFEKSSVRNLAIIVWQNRHDNDDLH